MTQDLCVPNYQCVDRNLSSRRGFSLIELLVVIAVVAVLGAIIIAAVGGIREKAHASKCLSNERAIATAILTSAQENGGVFPAGQSAENTSWVYALEPYYGGRESNVLVCPSRGIDPPSYYSWASSYSLNPRVMVDLANEAPRKVSLYNIPRPSEVILVADGGIRPNVGAAHGRFWQVDTANNSNPWPGRADRVVAEGADADDGSACFRYRHDGKMNVAYVDGHVEAKEKGSVHYRNLHIAY